MIFVILHPYLTIKNLNIFTTSLEKNKIKIKKGKYKMGEEMEISSNSRVFFEKNTKY